MTRASAKSWRQRGSFVLLEAMLAVAMFALGALALGRCISQGLAVERIEAEDARALRVLENRAAEIEAGDETRPSAHDQFPTINGGLTLNQSTSPLKKKDEHGQELTKLFLVKLEASWQSDGARQARTLNFYVWSP